MKVNLFISIFPLLFAMLFFTGCKKEGTDLTDQLQMKTFDAKSEEGGACQLTKWSSYDGINDIEFIDEATFKKSLVDEWSTSYGVIYKMEYGNNGKMKIARAYYDAILINTIDFIYKNNKVVKEIWYAGNTQNIEDEVTNTYNEKGQLIKSQSIAYDYIVLNKYNSHGDLESWNYFVGGLLNQNGVYTYNEEIKNPIASARPGIAYNFAWANSAFLTGKRWYSSEKITLYDPSGNPFVIYDLDPGKTKWVKGQQNNPLRVDYVDAITGGSIIGSFEYANCGGSSNNQITESLLQKSTAKSGQIKSGRKRPLLHGATEEVIKRLTDSIRQQ